MNTLSLGGGDLFCLRCVTFLPFFMYNSKFLLEKKKKKKKDSGLRHRIMLMFIWKLNCKLSRMHCICIMFTVKFVHLLLPIILKEIISQIDQYMVSLYSKTYIFEDRLTKYLLLPIILKEIISPIDRYMVSLSPKTYVFENKLTKYLLLPITLKEIISQID